MKILVTGGAGYIGSVLVPELLERGYEVTVIDNFLYKQTSLLDCARYPTFHLVRGDAREEKLIAEHIKEKDVIIPLAAIVGMPACDKDPYMAESVNTGAVEAIVKHKDDSQKIIFPNTNSGYGIGTKDVFCDETTPLTPISLYGRTKVKAEKEVLAVGNAVVFRLATVFGVSPRMRIDLLVNDFVYKALNDGYIVLFEADFKRNYIHVRDVARAFMHAIDNFEKMKNEVYNVGLSDANLSKRELCEEIKKQAPQFVVFESRIGKDVDKRNYIVSNEKMEKTGFRPSVSLEEGIRELIKGYQIVKRSEYSNL